MSSANALRVSRVPGLTIATCLMPRINNTNYRNRRATRWHLVHLVGIDDEPPLNDLLRQLS